MASVQADSPSLDNIDGFKVGSGSQCNVMLLLATVLASFSSAQLQNSAVEAQATLQETQIEINLSDKEMQQLQELTSQMQYIIDNPENNKGKPSGDGTYSDKQTNELSELNTEFSMTMQNGNMNVQTIQGFVQATQSISDADSKAQSTTASTAQVLSQFLQYMANKIGQSLAG